MSLFSRAGWGIIRSTLILWEKFKGNPTSFCDEVGPISSFFWGHFTVGDFQHAGGEFPKGVGSDIRVVGSQVSAWQERTDHVLTAEMITGVFDADIAVLVIGLGVCEAVKCSDDVVKTIKTRGIPEVICQRTPLACETYNRLLREGKQVALLAHGTC